jgi:ABC-2 type transport system ATP-binding protein
VIEINELIKYYGEKKAVGPLSFCIEQGEVVGLLGLNAAGKTTTLRMLSSELLPTSGSIVIDGVDLLEEPDRVRPKIGYLPDRPPLYGEMRVSEYLTFAARLRGMERGKIAKRVQDVLGLTALDDWADERIDTLSHGYQQRVGIGQAIVHEPHLLLLDEPISGLDPVQIVEMRALIRSLRGVHTTMLSSHILSEISETCDRLLVIRDGEIVASGSERELSAQMASGRNFEITVRMPSKDYADGPFAGLKGLLDDVSGVTQIGERELEGAPGDVVCATISATQDVRERLCKMLVQADCGILALERGSRELEDVFLQLTGSSGEAEERS